MDKKYGCGIYAVTKWTKGEHKKFINYLNRIEGQVRGIKGMAEKNSIDIITQVSAVGAALNAFNRQILSSHLKNWFLIILKMVMIKQ